MSQQNPIQAFLFLITTMAPACFAHSGPGDIHFVAEQGKNTGDCTFFATPCASLAYASTQAQKGDRIHVAQGHYSVDSEALFILLSDIIPVNGGFSMADQFTQQSPSRFETTLVGLPFHYREALAQKGFRLIADKKTQVTPKTQQALAIYEKATAKRSTPANCVNGKADVYSCSNIDMLAHLPLSELTGSTNATSVNDIWGHIDLNTNREYAVIGLNTGTAIVDVTTPDSPSWIGTIPGVTSDWRDVKVYQTFDTTTSSYLAYAYVTTEGNNGNLQIIDLNQLPDNVSLANTIDEFSTAHNVYITNVDYANGLALESLTPVLYIAGANKQGGAFRAFSLDNPVEPTLIAEPPSGTGYVHDATSFSITDSRADQCPNASEGRCDLVVDFNENTVDIWDFTQTNAPQLLSQTPYSGASYVHSGWWSEDKSFIFIQDELDESDRGTRTQLRTLDISNLTSPQVTHIWEGSTYAIDHNGFVKGDRYYMSNYRRGLSILDISQPNAIRQVGLFDTFPSPSDNVASFNGAWGVYPFLPSETLLVSDIEYGLFLLKEKTVTAPTETSVINFSQATFSTLETAGSTQITLTRQGTTTGEVTVRYQTLDDIADASDYEATSGEIVWAEGDSNNKSFSINIINDNNTTENRTEDISLTLEIIAGNAVLGEVAQAKLTIDDPSQPDASSGNATSSGGGGGGSLKNLLVLTMALFALKGFRRK
ncbi:MAG: choice-of-anchor B family protein [Pseudomonadota bacterium]